MDGYLLGIDVGTTGTKTLLFHSNGRLIAHAYRSYPTRTPEVGRSEQDPRDWWNAIVETVRQVCAEASVASAVVGISLSVQGGTMVPVDASGEPVRPAIVWNDNRCHREREAYLAEVGSAQTLYQKTGWELGYGMNALQIRWMRDHEPELFAKTAYFLSVPDYLSLRMTGTAAVDLSNLGINQLGNIRQGTYDPEILAFAGITQEKLPKIVRSGDVIGHLLPEAAAQLGLPSGIVLTAGAHDQYAVALGAGACHSGDILIGSGTCWVITCISDQPDFSSGLSQSVAAVPGMWGSLRSLSSGGICLDWWRQKLTAAGGEAVPYELINRIASARKAAEEGLFFYPFTGLFESGQSFTSATLLGLDLSHDKFHIARAIMEGVAFQIVWMLESFRTQPAQTGLILSGGAGKSELWCQLVADISGLSVRIPEIADLACVGAAVLAGVGSGVFSTAEAGYQRLAVGQRVIRPRPAYTQLYAPLLEQYKHNARILGQIRLTQSNQEVHHGTV